MDEHQIPREKLRPDSRFIELAIRVCLIGFLAYWTVMLIQPFAPIMVWSAALTVALYPIFDALAKGLGGRRILAAVIMTIAGLFLVIGPATWLGVGLAEASKTLIENLNSGEVSIPPPPQSVVDWPFIGKQVNDFWVLASTNLHDALVALFPLIRPYGETLLDAARAAGAGTLKFLLSVIIMGFLFAPGPHIVAASRSFARKIDPTHGDHYLTLAGATIRAVSRGVIGISLLQAVIGGIGMWAANTPGASLLTAGILALGVIQVGPLLIVAPTIFWAWTTMQTGPALAFTLCMLSVNYVDNVLKPFVLARGLTTPMPVVFIGVVGGVLAHGIVGLFVGPVVLAVAWELGAAWIKGGAPLSEAAGPSPSP